MKISQALLLRRTLGGHAEIPECATDEVLMLEFPLSVTDGMVDRCLGRLVREGLDRALVVRAVALRYECALAVALEVGDGVQWGVDRELLVVDSEAVAVGVWVREQTRLQDGVRRRLDVRYCVRGRKRYLQFGLGKLIRETGDGKTYLFDLGKVVLRVLVEDDFPDRAKRVILVRPDFGEIKDVVPEVLSLFGSHGLLGTGNA